MALHRQTATALRALIDRREVSCREVVDAHIARAEATEPLVGGFAVRRFDDARRRADALDARPDEGGLLRGLPLSIKENYDLAGAPTTLGVERLRRTAAADAVLVRTARAAGAVVMGKSNVPQGLLSSSECDNPVYGPTRNPWSAAHGPGGSSSGEGALLASGASVIGLGTDLGGSARFPAVYCGVVGLVPTPGRMSIGGLASFLPGQTTIRSQPGPMARTIDDLILLLRALDGRAQHRFDPALAPLPFDPVADPTTHVGRLRVGVCTDDGLLSPGLAVRRALDLAARALADAGAELVPYTIDDQAGLMAFYMAVMGSDGGATVRGNLARQRLAPTSRAAAYIARTPDPFKRFVPRVLGVVGEDRVAAVAARIGRLTVKDYWGLVTERDRLRQASLDRWDAAGIDLLLSPAAATAAPPIGASKAAAGLFAYTARANVLGRPAGVVPVTTVAPGETRRAPTDRRDRVEAALRDIEARSAGLPVGVQLMGRPWAEARVLAGLKVVEGCGDIAPAPIDPRPAR